MVYEIQKPILTCLDVSERVIYIQKIEGDLLL